MLVLEKARMSVKDGWICSSDVYAQPWIPLGKENSCGTIEGDYAPQFPISSSSLFSAYVAIHLSAQKMGFVECGDNIRHITLTCFPARGREQDELFPWDIVSLSFPPAENSKSCPHLCYKNSLCSRHHSLHRTNSKGAIKFSPIGNLPSPNNAAHSVATLVASRCYFSSIAKS